MTRRRTSQRPRRIAPWSTTAAQADRAINPWRMMAVVPVATEGFVVFGRLLTGGWAEQRIFRTRWDSDLALVKDAILTPLGE